LRDANEAAMQPIIDLPGGRRLDCRTHSLSGPRGAVSISPQASQFLQLLASKSGQIVRRDELIQAIWDGNALIGEQGLNRVVSEVRRAIGDSPRAPTLVQTVPRRGYRLLEDGAPPSRTIRAMAPVLWAAAAVVGLIVLYLVLELAIGFAWTIGHMR
jgi:DNA-binding response OmpR family regulator